MHRNEVSDRLQRVTEELNEDDDEQRSESVRNGKVKILK